MLRRMTAIVLLVCMFGMMGCSVHNHTIGSGAGSGATDQARQWYILFGLVPLNNVDTATMAAGATNYEIKTETSFLDIVIGLFTGTISVYSRTVTVTK